MRDISIAEKGNIEPGTIPVSIHDLISEVGNTLGRAASEKSIQLISYTDIRLPASVLADQAQLSRVLCKLVNNAIRFTEPDGTVSIEVISEKADDSGVKLLFVVEDTGIGMTGEQLSSLFKTSSEITDHAAHDKEFELSDCLLFARSMKGTIRAYSEPGAGSRFVLEIILPVVDANRIPVPDLSGIRILNAAGDICNLREIIGNSVRQARGAIKFVAGSEAAMGEINRAIDVGCPYHVFMFCRLWKDETRRELYGRIQKLPENERPRMLMLSSQYTKDAHYPDAVTMGSNPLSMNRIITNLAVATDRNR